jgi:hypothetical protein
VVTEHIKCVNTSHALKGNVIYIFCFVLYVFVVNDLFKVVSYYTNSNILICVIDIQICIQISA